MSNGPPSKTDLEALESLMETNFVGTVAVTQAMLPLLQSAGMAQIINVSSDLGCISRQTDPTWKHFSVKALAYGASKAALNMLTVQLAYEFRNGSMLKRRGLEERVAYESNFRIKAVNPCSYDLSMMKTEDIEALENAWPETLHCELLLQRETCVVDPRAGEGVDPFSSNTRVSNLRCLKP